MSLPRLSRRHYLCVMTSALAALSDYAPSSETPAASDFAGPWNVADVAEELRRTGSSDKPALLPSVTKK